MKKARLSITAKITIGATFLMFLSALVVVIIAGFLSGNLILGLSSDELVKHVEVSTEEIRIRDNSIHYGEAFSFVKNNVYMLILEEDGMVVAGKYPVNSAVEIGPPKEGFRMVTLPPGDYYVVDKKIPGSMGEESLWVRGVEAVSNAQNLGRFLIRLLLIIMPVFVILAALISFITVKRSLLPVKKILDTVDKIEDGKDLYGRIGMEQGNDEIHRLAESFDGMFERLSKAFNREKQFTADVSHELRTPLSVIRAQCDYLLNYCDNMEEKDEGIGVIMEQVNKMTGMTETLLALSRIEAGSEKMTMEATDFTGIITEARDNIILSCSENSGSFTWKTKTPVPVMANPELLLRAVENILENVKKYGGGYGVLEIKREKNHVVFSCKDRGPGIEKKDLPHVFEQFYRSDASRNSRDGTGLGLALTKRIIDAHGGTVWAENIPGEGACFYIKLPIIEKAPDITIIKENNFSSQ